MLAEAGNDDTWGNTLSQLMHSRTLIHTQRTFALPSQTCTLIVIMYIFIYDDHKTSIDRAMHSPHITTTHAHTIRATAGLRGPTTRYNGLVFLT